MTDDEIEAALERCGPGISSLVESAFQPYPIWVNMAAQCGLTPSEAPLVRAYIKAFYNPDGTSHVRPTMLFKRLPL